MGYIFDALNRSQPPDESRHDGDASPPPGQAAQPAPTPAPGDAAAAPQPEDRPQPQHPADADPAHAWSDEDAAAYDQAHAEAPSAGAAPTPTGHAAPSHAGAQTPAPVSAALAAGENPFASVDASLDRKLAELGENDEDDDAPGTLGAIEPIKTSRHIELNEHRLKKMDDRIVMLTEAGSQFAEEYRAIRTSLLARWQNKRNLVHVITSATPQEGKTITSLNLGLTLAELRSRRTLVIEADLRLPAFAKLLKLNDGPGLINYLRGEVTLEEAVQRMGGDGAYLLAAGDRAFDDAVSLLSGSRMQALLDHVRQRFDHVVIDTPPVIELADAGVLGGMSDDVLLIARMRRTSKRLIEQAVRTLGSYNAPVGGLIATDHQHSFGRYYAYRYRYRYGYRSRYHDYRKTRKAA